MVDPPPKTIRPRVPAATQAPPWRIETAGNQFNGRPLKFVHGSNVLITFSSFLTPESPESPETPETHLVVSIDI